MKAILEEREAVAADPEPEWQPCSAQADVAYPWKRFLRERGRSEAPRTAPRRWRDEEGL